MKNGDSGQLDPSEYSVESLGLVDVKTPPAFASLTRLAARLIGTPVSAIAIVQEDQDRQYFLSETGLGDPWKSTRQTPLSHSFCQHVKASNSPLVVDCAREHPLVKDNLAIDALGVEAYLGVPISMPDGCPVGALCVIESQARNWTSADLAALSDLALCVNSEIKLRASLAALGREHDKSQRYSNMRESISMAFMAPDLSLPQRFQEMLQSSCTALGISAGRIAKIDGGTARPLYIFDPMKPDLGSDLSDNLTEFTKLVAADCRHVYFQDLNQIEHNRHCARVRHTRGSYIGTPLVLNGVLYGVLEFWSDSPRLKPWSDDELSILSVVSMFTTAYLGVFGQLRNRESSERMSIQELMDERMVAVKI
jgi:signal transduction protein with GAF and PtsI domain